ncbi:putative selenium metabolism hydrolase [Austwickia chelonae]|uniref:Peptidase M20 family protein n=1 Tax=Austwickia chelonae NBRC 105200 TaxID=1184607 RepID=K6VV23_9MICO|nr:M20/M25/M40 family metallo-hydrolase [Austwickia chelonae]GAB79185.1 peptidase M20 family protein [Austwickia chelonae NBRC 105200]SEW37041.1 putative selenium metabolism hydrolase [Austwickia chelonae]
MTNLSGHTLERARAIATRLAPEMIEFTQDLVRIPSITGNEHAVSELLLERLTALGYHDAFRDDWGNVVGIIDGTRPGPSLMFNGHMDVVEAGDPATWAPYDPWGAQIDTIPTDSAPPPLGTGQPDEEAQVIHGRGVADLKGGMAAQVYAGAVLARLIDEGHQVPGRFLLTQVAMEEPGEMFSMRRFIRDTMPARGLTVDAMVCCEPSSLRLALGHRGRVELKVTVYGRSCHSSSPWLGVNALVHAARLSGAVEEGTWGSGMSHPELGRAGIAPTMLTVYPNALAIVPDKVEFILDRRTVPGETVEDVVAGIREVIDTLAETDETFRADVTVNSYERVSYTGAVDTEKACKEPWLIPAEHPFVRACGDGLSSVGEPVAHTYWPFSTDVPAVAALGKPCIGYSGTQEASIHTPHEYARIDYLERSLTGNVGIYLSAAELPGSAFTL